MNIEFKRIILHNFMSFSDADLRFNDDGFVRVSGINENPLDNASSNGSGKSSLWEAIIWALTGETVRGTKHIVNLYGEDGCFVDIEFYIDQTRYQIIRSKDHCIRKTGIQILVNGEDVSGKGVRDSEKILQQYLPDITASLLGSVIILGQGLPQKFTNNSPSGRKEVLEKLSKSDFMIEDLKKRVSDRKTFLQNELRTFENNVLEGVSKQQILTKQIEENNILLSSLNKDELEDSLTSFKEKKYKVAEELVAIDNDIESLNNDYTTHSVRLNELSTQETLKLSELQTNYLNNIQSYKDEQSLLSAELNNYNKQLKDMKSIKDVCPTCGQKLPDVHKPDTTNIEKCITEISDKLNIIKDNLTLFEDNYTENVKLVKSEYNLEKISITKTMQDIASQLSTLKNKKVNFNKEDSDISSSISAIELKLAQLQATIDNCTKIIRNNNESLAVICDNIMYNNKQKDLTQQHIDVISKFDTALKRDFRGYLLSTVINYIEKRAKYYSKIIFNNDSITFCLDGNNIDISYMGRAYENLSGGEKQKVDLIIQFSIRDMLSMQLGLTSNLIVLDEVFDSLDAIGCNKVIDMIASISDIKNIFIVTHRKDLSIPTDKELVVVKSSAGISEIRI